ncbi:4-hydroxy-tetrahydrodipicolinate reductase [Reichenbachiella agarivorans]|uniref:4-hydroxy-tetrahydrodipicolinate reductase n=1 Tax=Reichenbachiella agarivorans TaxID=2979464 RepID=A0ABY6CQJ7_9BACT|nr:4-hydroxy-tetrahydrodipicolinate reductase [Reichenbachiella agarivorans]UXP31718.1 4-hydroxy-tetrahydrodipicolinate reductase [Reichenbachiella agarivorans]
MNIGLVGYGKMGQAIEQILIERGHQVSKKITIDNLRELNDIKPDNTDVVIEFTSPESAFNNISTCLTNGVPVVSGSTGWLDRFAEVEALVDSKKGGFFYASNYSLGVNIFFKLNEYLAKLMNGRAYDSSMVETHHIQKLDAPSGTAITLAEGMMKQLDGKTAWVNEKTNDASKIGIVSERIENVPGTHDVSYSSEIDTITISHVAHSRKGFALGAVLAAEWLVGKSGVFSMNDLLEL